MEHRKLKMVKYAAERWDITDLSNLFSDGTKSWLAGKGVIGYEIGQTIIVCVPSDDLLAMLDVVEYLTLQGFWRFGLVETAGGDE